MNQRAAASAVDPSVECRTMYRIDAGLRSPE
jgi:hypothetical protein